MGSAIDIVNDLAILWNGLDTFPDLVGNFSISFIHQDKPIQLAAVEAPAFIVNTNAAIVGHTIG